MRARQGWSDVVAAACAAVVGMATIACSGGKGGCSASDSGGTGDAGDIGTSSGGDASGGVVQVNGTFTDTLCPSVNPLSVGPDNDGLVLVGATFNGTVEEGGVFTLTWTATSGAFTDPHALDTSFQCIAPGRVTVTFVVSGAGCDQRSTGMIICTTVIGSHV
jgi:hypothetical protein